MGGSHSHRRLALCAAWALLVAVATVAPAPNASAAAPKWTLVRTPDLAGASLNSLAGLTCLTTTECTAVGFGNTTNSAGKTLIERWDGTAWAIVPSPNPDKNAALYSVSCFSASACLAMGDSGKLGDAPFGERWDGTRWSLVTSPMPPSTELALPFSVSCTSATRCMVVGYTYSQIDGLFRTFAEQWDGKKLSILPTPNGPGGASFYAVTCSTAKHCIAAGSIAPTTLTRAAMVAQWDGAHWAIVNTPNPPGGKRSSFGGVACTSDTMCMATGTWARSNDQLAATFTLTERWDGKRWSYLASPKPIGAGRAQFNAVSCPSATSCIAVGNFTSTPNHTLTIKGFAEQWNGKSWAIVATPNPAGADYTALGSVSCMSAARCLAVGGSSSANQEEHTLAEVFG